MRNLQLKRWLRRIGGFGVVLALCALIVALCALLLEVPQGIAASLELSAKVPQSLHLYFIVLLYFLVLAAIVGIGFLSLWWWIFPGVSLWRVWRIAHPDQTEAERIAVNYRYRMIRELALLGMSIFEFSRRVPLSLADSWAIVRNPLVIPKRALWRSIARALLLPPDAFTNKNWNGDYGEELTRLRLERFITHKLVNIHLRGDIQEMSHAERASLLSKVEKKRMKELDSERRGGR